MFVHSFPLTSQLQGSILTLTLGSPLVSFLLRHCPEPYLTQSPLLDCSDLEIQEKVQQLGLSTSICFYQVSHGNAARGALRKAAEFIFLSCEVQASSLLDVTQK